MMPHPDGFFLRPIDRDADDERHAAWDDELDLARLLEERVDLMSNQRSASPYDERVHDDACRAVYGVARREEAHES
jgi:hypothetical protein